MFWFLSRDSLGSCKTPNKIGVKLLLGCEALPSEKGTGNNTCEEGGGKDHKVNDDLVHSGSHR